MRELGVGVLTLRRLQLHLHQVRDVFCTSPLELTWSTKEGLTYNGAEVASRPLSTMEYITHPTSFTASTQRPRVTSVATSLHHASDSKTINIPF